MKLNLIKSQTEDRIDILYTEMTPVIQEILDVIKKTKPILYGIKDGEKTLLMIDDIFYFDTVDRRCYAYTEKSVYQITQNISTLESDLNPFGFVRINKSNIVNIYHILRIKPEANMRIKVVLKNNEQLLINRSYKRNFENYLIQIRKEL